MRERRAGHARPLRARRHWNRFLVVTGLALGLSGGALPAADAIKIAFRPATPERVEVPPPPFSEGIFPCSNCHAGHDAVTATGAN